MVKVKFLFLWLAAPESVQYFQFDSEGNMFVFEPGAGCSGPSRLVEPGDDDIFNGESVGKTFETETSVVNESDVHVCTEVKPVQVMKHTFNDPLKSDDLKEL